MNSPKKPLVLIELNEINFDLVKIYIQKYPQRFDAIQELLARKVVETSAEVAYEQNEPWIQWVSVHTGLTFAEHRIFRLGDMVGSRIPQIFEMVEKAGYTVGCISPMNTENRLESPAYFIPDPWTTTFADQSWWSKHLSHAISQAVNDNAKSKITVKTGLVLGLGLLRFARVKNYRCYFDLLRSAGKRSWSKALLFDLFLSDVHACLMNSRPADFSVVFFNSGAHIQHHYMLNAEPVKSLNRVFNPSWYIDGDVDPILDMLDLYNRIISDYVRNKDITLLVATGLSQVPYDRLKFYYRLKDHVGFLKMIGVSYKSVSPRMTRDFLIEFNNEAELKRAIEVFTSIRFKLDGVPLFGSIDVKGLSAFITLTYPNEILESSEVLVRGSAISILDHVVFVALKNGMHCEKGYAFFDSSAVNNVPVRGSHVSALFNYLKSYFEIA